MFRSMLPSDDLMGPGNEESTVRWVMTHLTYETGLTDMLPALYEVLSKRSIKR